MQDSIVLNSAWIGIARWMARTQLLLAALGVVVAAAIIPAHAGTLLVTNTNDSGTGSLRAAIAAAQNGDLIKFKLRYPATIPLTSGALVIGTNVTIAGPGASNLAISGSNSSKIFYINPSITVAMSGLTIENGYWGGGDVYYNGGGAIENLGTLTLSKSTVLNSSGAFGGGINNWGPLTISQSTIRGNTSCCGLAAGGIANFGTVTVAKSTLTGNYGYYDGGGIFNQGTATVTQSTFSGNYAQYGAGGGIMNGGVLTVTNSTFSGNAACGPYNPGNGYASYGIGGGIANGGGAYDVGSSGTVNVSNSTFSGNCGYLGGATLAWAGTTTLKNTLLANSSSAGNCYNPNGATLTSKGHNLADDSSCSAFLSGVGDMNGTPAGLDPNGLQNNGGPTQTIGLLPSSPAVNAIPKHPTNYCTDTSGSPVKVDQRGIYRQGNFCDIGAFEYLN